MMLWVDAAGWLLVTDEGKQHTSGQWQGNAPWPELERLIADNIGKTPLHLVLSPEFFVYLREPFEGAVPPAELARKKLGLALGAWTMQTRILDGICHIAAFRPETVSHLELLMARWPLRLRICLVPLFTAAGATDPMLLRFGQRHVIYETDGEGKTLQWHWLPEPLPGDLPRKAMGDRLADLAGSHWLTWEGKHRKTYLQLTFARKLLFRATTVIAMAALVVWSLWSTQRKDIEARRRHAQAYLDTHQEEARRIEAIQASGEVAWEKLHQIQTFSNRTAPMANHLAALANVTGTETGWKSFSWDDKSFTVNLTGQSMSAILDYVDEVRQLPRLAWLRTEEVTNQARTRSFEVKIEGGFE